MPPVFRSIGREHRQDEIKQKHQFAHYAIRIIELTLLSATKVMLFSESSKHFYRFVCNFRFSAYFCIMKQRTEEEYYIESKRLREETIRMADALKDHPLRFVITNVITMDVEITKSDL